MSGWGSERAPELTNTVKKRETEEEEQRDTMFSKGIIVVVCSPLPTR